MKRTILIFLIVLTIGIISANRLMAIPQEEDEWKNDDFGRVIGQIIDADTGEPVNEHFWIQLFPFEKSDKVVRGATFKNGSFSIKAKPGRYAPSCSPYAKSEYSDDPDPIKIPEVRQEIKVEKGQITKVFKKAYRAGKLKIVIVDINGARIIPKNLFSDADIQESLDRTFADGNIEKYLTPLSAAYNGYLEDGERTIGQLYPATYTLEIDFRFTYLGYGSRRFENISIEKNKTTEIKVVLDLTDQTGVYGKVVDMSGNPVEDVHVRVLKVERSNINMGYAETYTDSNGNYKLIGISEGPYDLRFSRVFKPFISYDIPDENIVIEKNKMIEKNRQIKTPPVKIP
ncbi:MAG: Carboxypeptidase regulatory-like domain [Acidobacteriota bacterium]|nr:Carboxypeptidase regulatory-like domain [Acidobacteriota bacterium]